MGQVWKPNRAMSVELLLAVLDETETRIQDVVLHVFIVVAHVVSLRGAKGLLLNLASLNRHWGKGEDCITLALLGKIRVVTLRSRVERASLGSLHCSLQLATQRRCGRFFRLVCSTSFCCPFNGCVLLFHYTGKCCAAYLVLPVLLQSEKKEKHAYVSNVSVHLCFTDFSTGLQNIISYSSSCLFL
jgi:hypothetical protein